jgi:putative ATP-binding cassette transporter
MRLHEITALKYLIKRFRWALLAAALASVVSGTCGVVVVSQINTALTSDIAKAHHLGLRFGMAAVLAMVAGMISNILFQRLRQHATAELRQYICARVMHSQLRQLEQVGPSQVQSALSEHTSRVTDFFVSVPTLLTNGVIVLGGLIYLVLLSPRIFLITVPFVALGALGYHLVHLKAIHYLRVGTAEQERLFEHFRSLTEGAKELRLNRRKRFTFSEGVLRRSIEIVRRQRTTGMSLFVGASSWGNFLIYAFLGVVLFVVAGDISDRARVLTGFALVMVYIVGPLQSLLLAVPSVNLVTVAAERIEKLTREIQSTEDRPVDAPVAAFRSLALKGVKHRYYHEHSNEVFELGPIDLALHPGEITFIVGGNGSGKTTLAKLLVGLYPPEEGTILLNDVPIDDSNRDHHRQQFSAIFSDFHLFDSLLEDGRSELDSRGNRLLSRLQLQHKVQLCDGAFTTRALSHGQRKRLALVVAYLEDRSILVFDEWAADQDPAFKDIFYFEILRDLRELGKAVVVISHDDRYFHVADRIIRLENGQILSGSNARPVSKPRLVATDASSMTESE